MKRFSVILLAFFMLCSAVTANALINPNKIQPFLKILGEIGLLIPNDDYEIAGNSKGNIVTVGFSFKSITGIELSETYRSDELVSCSIRFDLNVEYAVKQKVKATLSFVMYMTGYDEVEAKKVIQFLEETAITYSVSKGTELEYGDFKFTYMEMKDSYLLIVFPK